MVALVALTTLVPPLAAPWRPSRRFGARWTKSRRRNCTAGCRKPKADDEIGRLAATMNRMLERLEGATK